MAWIGDLERAFATNLYPLRAPIAIGMLIALVLLAITARRRGWLASARRHRGRATAVLLALLVVGLPVGWYLGSPLFIRTALVEAAPEASQPTATPGLIETAGPPSTQAPGSERSGAFTGADDFHFGSGTARLLESAPGTWVIRFEGFSVRNGPDLFVYLSPDAAGYGNGVVELGPLKATDGDFNTAIPDGTNVASFHSVVIWCKQFAVQFAVAPLD